MKVAGADLGKIDRVLADIEHVARQVPGVSSAFAERLSGGRYIDVHIDRASAARYGLNISDVQSVIAAAVGGDNIGETVEGLQRFPINVRYPRDARDSVEALRRLPMLTERGAQLRLSDVASIAVTDGPSMLKSENGRLSGWVYVDVRGRDLRSAVRDLQRAVSDQVKVPPGYSISWSGQFEYLERATRRLTIVVPAVLATVFVLLVVVFRRASDALIIMATLPLALVGGLWLMDLLGYDMSVASAVGFIALAGVASEIGVVMLVYINSRDRCARGGRHARGRACARRGHRRRCGASRAADHDDRLRRHRGFVAHHVEQRNGIRGHAPHCRADDGRDDHGARPLDVRRACGVPGRAPSADARSRSARRGRLKKTAAEWPPSRWCQGLTRSVSSRNVGLGKALARVLLARRVECDQGLPACRELNRRLEWRHDLLQ